MTEVGQSPATAGEAALLGEAPGEPLIRIARLRRVDAAKAEAARAALSAAGADLEVGPSR